MDRITEVTRECVDALIQLRRLDESSLPSAADLQAKLRGFIDAMFQRAAQAGFAREDANDIAYALIALADEIVLSRSGLRETWAGASLQLHYFGESVAGEAFFTRLQNVRRDPRRREVLQVYTLVLLLGFQGQYKVRGGELELMSLVEGLQRELARGGRFEVEVLSPHGERPDEGRASRRRFGLVAWIAAGAAALALLLYVGFRASLGVSSDAVAKRIETANLR